MFLTQGITAKFDDYHDPRTHNIPMGVHFVSAIGILVISLFSFLLLNINKTNIGIIID